MRKFYAVLLVVAILFLTIPASASDLGFKRLGGKVGLLFPSTNNIDYSVGFMFGAAADMGEITDDLKLIPLISYWTAGGNFEGFSDLDVSTSNVQIGADVQYYLKDVKGLYFGSGLSINFISGSEEYISSGTDIGIDFLAGYEMPIGKNSGFANLKYNIITDYNTLLINIGMWFDMN